MEIYDTGALSQGSYLEFIVQGVADSISHVQGIDRKLTPKSNQPSGISYAIVTELLAQR